MSISSSSFLLTYPVDMACDIGFTLRREGVTIPYTDILIATCALARGCTILHADNHFDLMAEHINLKAESFVTAVRKNHKQSDFTP